MATYGKNPSDINNNPDLALAVFQSCAITFAADRSDESSKHLALAAVTYAFEVAKAVGVIEDAKVSIKKGDYSDN